MLIANLYVNILVSVAVSSITRLCLQRIGNLLQIPYPNNSYYTKLLLTVKLMKALKPLCTKFNALSSTLQLILFLTKSFASAATTINTHLTVPYYIYLSKNLVILLNLLKNLLNILIPPISIKTFPKLINSYNVTFYYLPLLIQPLFKLGSNMLIQSGNNSFMLAILKTPFYFDNKLTKQLTKDVLTLQHTLLRLLTVFSIVTTNLFTLLI